MKTRRALRSAADRLRDDVDHVGPFVVLCRLGPDGRQIGDRVRDHSGRPGMRVGEFLLGGHDLAHPAREHCAEDHDEHGHHERHRPCDDGEHSDRTQHGDGDAQHSPRGHVDHFDERPREGLERRDDLARRSVGVPAVAEIDEVVVAVGDGPREGAERRTPVQPARDAPQHRRDDEHARIGDHQWTEGRPEIGVRLQRRDPPEQRGEDEGAGDRVRQRPEGDRRPRDDEPDAVGPHLPPAVGEGVSGRSSGKQQLVVHGGAPDGAQAGSGI